MTLKYNNESYALPAFSFTLKFILTIGLYDLGASVSIMSYSLFHKLHRGPLLATSFSLQLADGSMTQPMGKLEDVSVNIGDISVLEDFNEANIPKTDDAQLIVGRLILTTAGCHIDVRGGRISFEVKRSFAMFSHRKEDAVSPHSSIFDALPFPSEYDMEDVLNDEDPPDSK